MLSLDGLTDVEGTIDQSPQILKMKWQCFENGELLRKCIFRASNNRFSWGDCQM
jgi:hypothetical protein